MTTFKSRQIVRCINTNFSTSRAKNPLKKGELYRVLDYDPNGYPDCGGRLKVENLDGVLNDNPYMSTNYWCADKFIPL